MLAIQKIYIEILASDFLLIKSFMDKLNAKLSINFPAHVKRNSGLPYAGFFTFWF